MAATTVKKLVMQYKVDLLVVVEPRISRDKAKEIIRNFGFRSWEIVDATGFSGGIWLLWNETKVKVKFVEACEQALTVQVFYDCKRSWYFSAIYGSPDIKKRNALWEFFYNFKSRCDLPWLLVGDFNELLAYDEKNGALEL
ncbi:hypothetical protein ACFX13_018260 [Malus domestica]